MTQSTKTLLILLLLLVAMLFILIAGNSGGALGAFLNQPDHPTCAIAIGGAHEQYQTWQVSVDGQKQVWDASNDNPNQVLAGPIWKVGDAIWYNSNLGIGSAPGRGLYRVTALDTSNYTMSVKSIAGC